ncbi:hypothetical protein [Priestia megaterium]|uniref:Uncharacterized protein n=1 Tax=Priestia megaterium (strain DSM 319 / IMG 1521) TaxID=592022 RepID=D5DIH4_PRIM3|nr:hypothetical protein [Priestia megaterium]ADF40275.1 hypothetical protein BMD_3435 [Priestia megaterium DSM 319]MED4216345.1 hypothetical protein [Priestia megaterium]WEZ39383.1 hypothetical protein P5636_03595 [Priestia megaterium DSM 319]
MKKLLSFLFLAALYLYDPSYNRTAFLHKPVVSAFLYGAAIFACALLLVNVKKDRAV